METLRSSQRIQQSRKQWLIKWVIMRRGFGKSQHAPLCHLFFELLSPRCLSFLICKMRIRQGRKSVWHIIHAHKAVVIIFFITVTSKYLNKWRLSTIHLVQPTTTLLKTTITSAKSYTGFHKEILSFFYLKTEVTFFSNNCLYVFFWNKLYIHIDPSVYHI